MSDLILADTHCHLDFDVFSNDRDAVIQNAWHSGVRRILTIGIDLPSSHEAIKIASTYEQVYAAVGVHPNSATSWTSGSLDELRDLASHPKVMAIGEIGLDYYRQYAPHDVQQRVFLEQLALAKTLNKPIVLHTRNAINDPACINHAIDILEDWVAEIGANKAFTQPYGVFHSFSGDIAQAERCAELGFYLGITGPVTFKNAQNIKEVVQYMPLEKLLIETDAPFLTPHPYRGKRNQPAYVKYIAEEMARIKKRSLPQIASITSDNAQRLFGWSKYH